MVEPLKVQGTLHDTIKRITALMQWRVGAWRAGQLQITDLH